MKQEYVPAKLDGLLAVSGFARILSTRMVFTKVMAALAIVATALGGCAVTGVINPTEEVTNTKIDAQPFGALADGTYRGSATVMPPAGTIVMGRTVSVAVTVTNGTVAEIKVESPSDMNMIVGFDQLPKRVVEKGSLNVDCISGATYSSIAFLKAVEKAVKK
jgi:uncharacterized protein with FMN-binding domain